MSNHTKIEEPFSRLAIRPTVGAAIAIVLALGAVAAALIIAAVNPKLDGHVIAVATGIVIGAIALAVAIATAVLGRLRLPNTNDAWVFW